MAGQRKVGNLMALAVLAALFERPMHRYEMASLLRARGKDRAMEIKWGSLYTVVQGLERHGLVEAVGTTRQGARPERTVYRITDAGRAELVDWLRELLAEPQPARDPFAAGLSVLALLPPDEVVTLLRARLDRLTATAAQRRADVAALTDLPRLFLVEEEYALALLDAEVAWVRGLLDELTTGTHPSVEPWREWHATGALPAGWEELAQRGVERGAER